MPHKDIQRRKEYKKWWNKKYYKNHREEELERTKNRKKQMREWFNNYKKTLACSKCGENNPACLEFHHLDRKQKSFGISESIIRKGYSKGKILSEIKKCSVLCANCHRKLHS